MRQVSDYDIHGLLRIRIVGERRHAILGRINDPLAHFKVSEGIGDPDITLNLGRFVPDNHGCYDVDHKYMIKENYLYCRDATRGAGWEAEITGFENGPKTLNFHGRLRGFMSLFPGLIPCEMLLMPGIIHSLSKKGCYLMHGAGICDKDMAYVLAARGGSSKTAIVRDFVRLGYGYLGDDWVAISKGRVLAFPKSLAGFAFGMDVNRLPYERSSSIADKLRYLGYQAVKPPGRHRFKIIDNARLKKLIVLTKIDGRAMAPRAITVAKAVEKLVPNVKMEMVASPNLRGMDMGCYLDYLTAYAYVFPGSPISKFWESYATGLGECLHGVRLQEMEMDRYDFGSLHRSLIAG